MKISIETLSEEKRIFLPKEEFRQKALIKDLSIYKEAEIDPAAFWEQCAEKELLWKKRWDQVVEGEFPHVKWFGGGVLNISENCLDRHLGDRTKNQAALIWEGERGEEVTWTYQHLFREVCKLSNGMKSLGVKKGDRVAIYMPLVPEAIASMLACARIGAIHTVIFGGFSSEALKERIQDAAAKLLITADGGFRKGGVIPLKQMADQAVKDCPSIQHVIVHTRTGENVAFNSKRDVWYRDLLASMPYECEATPMAAEDPLFILYTSGTTGKPKGILHTTGGYLLGVHMTMKWVFDLKAEDIFWCTADIGWITGHSYVAYGPLSHGATGLIYEGSPDWPKKDRFWEIIEKYRVSIFYTAPTAIRTFMRWGIQWPKAHDLSSLRLLGTVGEPINPEAWMWYYEQIGGSRCPIVDTWWQTETGSIMISPLPAVSPLKPGSAGKALPGIEIAILDGGGEPSSTGLLAIKAPWPSMLRGIYNDEERYIKTYWSKWKNGYYFTGDGVKRDNEGFLWLLGRVDDVMNISGHRIGTAEVESALVDHPVVAEAAVIGAFDEIKGQAIVAFVILKENALAEEGLEEKLKEHVVIKIGALARPKTIYFTRDLPKTRSGKIMRRLLRDIAEGKVLGDVTTLADPSIVQELYSRYEEDNG